MRNNSFILLPTLLVQSLILISVLLKLEGSPAPYASSFTCERRAMCIVCGLQDGLVCSRPQERFWTLDHNDDVDTRRLISTEKQWELTMTVHQERSSYNSNEIEQLVSVTSVHPPSHDSPMSGSIEKATTTPTTRSSTTTTPKYCPDGYQVFPGFNCYKIYPENEKNWTDAREECRRNGGELMVIETDQEAEEVYIPLCNSVSFSYYPWMGVYIPEGEDDWMSVKGEPALSTWWRQGQPYSDPLYRCAWADKEGLLESWTCADQCPFICEIPI